MGKLSRYARSMQNVQILSSIHKSYNRISGKGKKESRSNWQENGEIALMGILDNLEAYIELEDKPITDWCDDCVVVDSKCTVCGLTHNC